MTDLNPQLNATPPADEAPRRGASAQYTVSSGTGAEAAMRQAMDPANQSLGEALRLSYRVLQVAILALVVVFLFSGFQTVQEGQTGVKTFFGRIVGAPGDEQVSPGLQPFWPYPVGEIVLLPQKDAVELNGEFWPRFKQGMTTVDQAAASTTPDDPIRPGLDGSLITADGDLAHVRIAAEYTVEDAVRTLDQFQPDSLREIVRHALARGMVQTAAQFTLQELLENRDGPEQSLRQRAQATLDSMKSGVKLGVVTIPEKIAPLAIRNTFSRVQEARENGKLALEQAQQEANGTLVGMAGADYAQILDLVQRYETDSLVAISLPLMRSCKSWARASREQRMLAKRRQSLPVRRRTEHRCAPRWVKRLVGSMGLPQVSARIRSNSFESCGWTRCGKCLLRRQRKCWQHRTLVGQCASTLKVPTKSCRRVARAKCSAARWRRWEAIL